MTALLFQPYPHIQVQESTTIRADVYPANVTFSFGDNPYPFSRAIITMSEVVVLVEGGTQILVLYRAPMLDVDGSARIVTVTTEDGQVTVTKKSGCGCGSGLKSYRPYRNAIRMAS